MYLTDSALDRLREEGFRGRIMISFDGAGYHDTMRRHPGAEKIVLDVIRRVVRLGIDLLINMNVNRQNRDCVAGSLDILDSLGVPAVRLIRTVGTPRWEMNGGSDTMAPKKYYDFSLDCMKNYMSAPHRMDVQFREFASVYPQTHEYGIHPVIFEDDAFQPEALSCGIARRRIAVTASGEILPCMQAAGKMEEMHMSMGNYFRDGLKPHLTDSQYLDLVSIPVSSRHGDNDECRTCPWFRQCLGGCRLQAKLYTGSFYGPDPTRCDFFKNGFRQKIIGLGDAFGWKRVLKGE
ncbi:MAG: radical SAM protein [Clostridia bacterium]|nr:radical SAM protein [Clostridia bacterium]